MELEQLLELIRAVSASELTEFKYEEKSTKIHMEKKQKIQLQQGGMDTGMQINTAAMPISAADGQVNAEEQTASVSVPGNEMVSPLVGTFYAAAKEDEEPFVRVGDPVRKGQTLAIIEAMKLMNEIESEYDGVVTEILVENGQAVEYGQPLFRIA